MIKYHMKSALASAVPRARSPYEAFAAQAAARPGATILSAPAAAELAYAPDGFAAPLRRLRRRGRGARRRPIAAAGYGPGMRAGLLLENRPVFFRHWMALNALGVSIVPINPDLKPDEIAFQLGLAPPERWSSPCPSGTRAGRPLRLSPRRASPLPDGGTCPRRAPPAPRRSTPGLEAECALLFTSGTSGAPKGCILSNRYFLQPRPSGT
jgi:acyl-CoA synthetase (AMP-forming)/AMP-acid ligase II